jgi:hypothetical protein
LAGLGCKNTLASFETKPTAIGTTNQVIVVADNEHWAGMIGDTLEYYFGGPYPIMPQPEPLFDLKHYTASDLVEKSARRSLRTYLFLADLSDEESPTAQMVRNDLGAEKLRRFQEDPGYFSSVGYDKWARGQMIVYLFERSEEALANSIVRAFPTIAERINQHDLTQVHASTYITGESVRLERTVREKFDISLKIPNDYKVAIDQENFLWLRKDDDILTSNILIRRFPYTDRSDIDLENIIRMRDRLGIFIQGSTVGSVMQTNDEDLPVYTYQKDFDGHFAIESRGIWEMTLDFLGGPFINYAIIDGSEILMIDCFVYAPDRQKRNYVQHLEHIVSSLKFEEAK